MKRERDSVAMPPSSSDACSSTPTPPRKRRTVSGKEHGFLTHASVVEEIDEVHEYHTILLRFPCFDFFRHVHLCETSRPAVAEHAEDLAPRAATAAASTHAPSVNKTAASATDTIPETPSSSLSPHGAVRFAPEALQFVPHTLATDRPVAVLNEGTTNVMVFEGQWSEVVGDGTAVTNRAVVHLASEEAVVAQTGRPPTPSSSLMPAPASRSPAAAASAPSPVASLLPHADAGVTADEERRTRTEQLRGWVYDRVDVPSAVLVMQRVR